MARTVYINGQFCAEQNAQVSIFDRGLLFADAVYEVVGVLDGKLIDFPIHMQRLARSLGEMQIPAPLSDSEILETMRALVRLNRIEEGLIYMQITRGAEEDRDFVVGKDALRPTVFMFTQHKLDAERRAQEIGMVMASAPDLRWARRDIKTTALMGSVFAKQIAKAAGADEVLMHEDGIVTEGGSTSFFIVKDGTVITRPLSRDILHGCTRRSLMALVASGAAALDERVFTLEEASGAHEAFITAASSYVCPIVRIDDSVIGSGSPGPITQKLQKIYMRHVRANLT